MDRAGPLALSAERGTVKRDTAAVQGHLVNSAIIQSPARVVLVPQSIARRKVSV